MRKKKDLEGLVNRLKAEALLEKEMARKVLQRYSAHDIVRILDEPKAFPSDFWQRIQERIQYDERKSKDYRGRRKRPGEL